jgi:hypothetical protein
LCLGVVPPDIQIAVRNQGENYAKYKSKAQFLRRDSRPPSKETREAAEQMVDIIESG